MDTADRFLQDLMATTQQHADLVRAGARAAESRMEPPLRNLAACWRRAQKDEQAKIPTYLSAAIENATRLMTLGADPYEDRRKEPRSNPAHDSDPFGRPLRPGT